MRRLSMSCAQKIALIAVAVLVAVGVALGCTEAALRDARPTVTAIEGGLLTAGQPAAAGAVEAGFRAWEAAVYAAGAIAAAWGAKAGVRAVRKRRAPRAGP